ncbi:MAG: SPW repeat domain-containing protein [Propionibacteriaceae bacterium]
MKKWRRWEDYVAIAAGLFTVLGALIWTSSMGSSRMLMVLFGGLLIITGVLNLSMPSTPWLEYSQCGIGVLLFLSPWIGRYAASAVMSVTSAAWTSWIVGIITAVVTAAAFRPVLHARHDRMVPQH